MELILAFLAWIGLVERESAQAGFGEMIRLPLTSAEAIRWSRVELR